MTLHLSKPLRATRFNRYDYSLTSTHAASRALRTARYIQRSALSPTSWNYLVPTAYVFERGRMLGCLVTERA